MNILIAFGLAGFVGFCSYVLGLRRGTKIGIEEAHEDYKKAYWEGYTDGRLDPHPSVKQEFYEEGFQDGKDLVMRRTKISKMVDELDELFNGEDKNIIDGGEY